MTRKTEQPHETITDIVTEKKKRNRDMSNWGQEYIEPGDNRKYISLALESMNMPKLDFDDVPSVQERINWYFRRCMEYDMKPGVVGLANALGVDRKTLWSWKTEIRRESNVALVDTIKKAYVMLEEMWENYMLNGKISPPNGIFLGKNNFDYRDEQQIVITPNNPLETGNPSEVRNKYIQALPESEQSE